MWKGSFSICVPSKRSQFHFAHTIFFSTKDSGIAYILRRNNVKYMAELEN